MMKQKFSVEELISHTKSLLPNIQHKLLRTTEYEMGCSAELFTDHTGSNYLKNATQKQKY